MSMRRDCNTVLRMMKSNVVILNIFLLIGVAIRASAISPAPSSTASPTPPPCAAPEFRQFDFWLGRWKVTNPKGVQVGTSEISRVSEGCAVREQWTSARGQGGTSLNYYDSSGHEWHQDWIGGDGTILHLHGGMKNGTMVLTDESPGAKSSILNRITFTPLPDGKVRQEWAMSKDEGATWQISFVGTYEKVTG
jgi:hypothetical protein